THLMIIHQVFSVVGINLQGAIRTALDVGCGRGWASNALVARGIETYAIDLQRSPKLDERVHFTEVALEAYEPDQPFDLVFARSVLPHTEDPIHQISRLFGFGKYVLFNVF